MNLPAASASDHQAMRHPGPPRWMVVLTGAVAALSFAMAIAETNWWMHYVIDDGEYLSLVGLAVVTVAGLSLHRARRLAVSLPLVVPWLLFPVITQGDQLIDNLSIGWMRLITHVLLAALFATPVAVIVLAVVLAASRADLRARRWMALVPGLQPIREGRVREGAAVLTAALLVAEIWVAARALGMLMIITLVLLTLAVLTFGTAGRPPHAFADHRSRRLTERRALGLLLAGVVASLAVFVGFKHRPGAYQGSPSYFMDPSRQGEGFRLDAVPTGTRAPAVPAHPERVQQALVAYAHALDRLITGYYLLDRNYTYDFHNHLFLRRTPLLADYRAVALAHVHAARTLQLTADGLAVSARAALDADDPLRRLLDDVQGYTEFNMTRAPRLEQMSGAFERTPAGLQHAAHLYEGEGKVVTDRLSQMLDKHQAVLQSDAVAPVTGEFVARCRAMVDRYANRIVGF